MAPSPYRIIDISQWVGDFTYPGDSGLTIEGPFNHVSGLNREYVHDLRLSTQSGSHIQGPHYFLEDGARINDFDLPSFEGPAVVIDLEKRGIDTTREDLIAKLDGARLENQVLILRTGHMDEVVKEKTVDFAKRSGLSIDAAHYLAEDQKIKMIAIDSLGIESRVTKNYEVNKYFCSKGILILEELVNLAAIKQRNVFLEAFPLKIRGVEGTPCRAIVKELV